VTAVRDLAWRNLKMLNPALLKMEANKAAFLAGTGGVPMNTSTKSLHGVYGHERSLYVKSSKRQTYSASLLHGLHSQDQRGLLKSVGFSAALALNLDVIAGRR
jgi:hypothetical protein